MRREKFAVGLLCLLLSVWTFLAPSARADVNESRSTVLIIDVSGSMKGAKLSATKAAAGAYVSALPADVSVGVVAFSTQAKVVLAPTPDRAAVASSLASLRAGGGTSLYDAALVASQVARRARESRMVVITDGNDSTSKATLLATAKSLASLGIPLDAVEVRPDGSKGAGLRQLAAATHGKVVTTRDAGRLAALLAALPPVAQPDPPSTAGEPLSASSALLLVLLICFAGAFVLLLLVFWAFGGLRRKRNRVHAIVEAYSAGGTGPAAGSEASLYDRSPVMGAALSVASRVTAAGSLGGRLGVLLSRGGLGLQPAEWQLVQAGLIVGLVVVFGLLFGNLLVGLLLGLVCGLLSGHGWLVLKAKRRARAFDERLPDALQLLAGGLASGFAFPQAVDSVAQRGPEPVAVEFGRALGEARLGSDLEDALDRVATRMDSRDLRLTVMSIRIQREVGGNLAETLRTTVATMRERAYLRRQVRTLGAEGRLSAYILTALPIGLAVLLFLVRGEYVRTLYTDPIGLALVAGAVVSMGIGALVMRKIVQVEA